ncbi:hypothetical protein [Methylobacterium iners]|jgi:hypothetical protein|uniref:Uncharacterized protein n=1 Tax=Methylobacterium iners TaxID=418707 RepID=A0ABQ4S3Q3_9HYPH|nr:hypothetical protein [Methylobacterium iners]GJD96438.1 hypothetical protein OCOJLMKI_3659 [Methylobacterium iners]
MRPAYRAGLAALILFGAIGAQGAAAQYDDEDYDRPPPRGYDERRGPPRGRSVGLNCDAVQSGLAGLQPFSCPLPGPRPLGTRCYCDMPIAPFNGPQTAVGRVVP